MIMKKKLFIIFALIILFGLLFFWLFKNRSPKSINKQPIVLWAWERPENLMFIKDFENANVAFLAGSITIKDNEIQIQPRKQPLGLPENLSPIAVVRIDNFDTGLSLTPEQELSIENFILEMCTQSDKISGCQIDFDATVSEREYYEQLLGSISQKLPTDKELSITALVSWCNQNSWLENLPIKYAVPMFFRLGPDEKNIKKDLTGQDFMKSHKCQKYVGISTDESLPIGKYLKNRTIFIFNPDSWTNEDYKSIMNKINARL